MNPNEKTALVTGATNGIGKVTALELARAGHRVLVVSRDRARGERVLEELRQATSNPALELYVGDLSNMSDVRRVALEVRSRHPRLEVLIHNAGGVFVERQLTADGFERTLALNHLAPFLMTKLLLDPLQAAPAARVVSVSSNANRLGRLRWNDLEFQRGYMGFSAYSQSKLMTLLFTFALARRLHGTRVTSNALHPGVVKSGFWDHASGVMKPVFGLIKRFAGVSPEQGAETTLFLATSNAVDGVTGQYFERKQISQANPVAYDEAAQERLWALSEGWVGGWLEPAQRAALARSR